jgi:signal transduction histidine kinase
MAEALKASDETPFDLVLMDIRLRGDADGIDAARALRENHGLPVIFLTAHGDRDTLARAKSTEPLSFVLKPFKPTELLIAIEIALVRVRAEKDKMDALKLMAAGIAHDFNNILTAVGGTIELAMEAHPDTQALLESAQEGIASAGALTRQLLAYVGKGALVCKTVSVARTIEGTLRTLRPSIPDRICIHTELDQELTVLMDPSQLEQIIMNLVLNSAEAISETGNITIQIRKEKQYANIEVIDTGSDMTPEIQNRTFFSTKFTGRGMGLAAVKGIVHALHGDVVVTSNVGQGTNIRVSVPLLADSEPLRTALAQR